MAQDFFAAFGHDEVGTFGTDTTINSGDLAGILMVAAKELALENEALKQRLVEREAKDAERDTREAKREERLARLGLERKSSHRLVFEAVLYRECTGCPWRDLPSEHGDSHSLSMRWQRWVKGGVPQRAMVAWYLQGDKAGELDLS